MRPIDTKSLARMGIWAMCYRVLCRRSIMTLSGFSEAERARLLILAQAIDRRAFVRFVLIREAVAVIVGVIAIIGVLGLRSVLHPSGRPSLEIMALIFSFFLFALYLLMFKRAVCAFRISDATLSKLTEQPGDAQLEAKIKGVIARGNILAFGVIVLILVAAAFLFPWLGYYLRGSLISTLIDWLLVPLGLLAIAFHVRRMMLLAGNPSL